MKKDGMLDKVDKQLLYWLDLNCRSSLSSLAKHMRTSPAKLGYRLEQLKKSGIIWKFITLIDYRKIGYRGYGAYYKLKEMSDESLEKLLAKIMEDAHVVDLVIATGAYDLQVAILTKTSDEAAESVWKIRGILGPYILEETSIVQLQSQFFARENFLDVLPKKVAKPRTVLDKPDEKSSLDEADSKILATLAENADWPLWKIAKETGIKGPTVYNRIKKLEKDQIIVGYTIKMNPNINGFFLYRIFAKLNYLPKKRREEFLAYLDQHPSIHRSSFTFGPWDFYYDARLADDTKLRELLQDVYSHFSQEVVRQDWVRVHKILKFSFYHK